MNRCKLIHFIMSGYSTSDSTNLLFSQGSVLLNSEQYSVVKASPLQNQRILAGAGSGKTTTITARIAYLIEKCSISADKILLTTFSRAAAEEMQIRVARLCGTTGILAGTFHAIAARVLKDHSPDSIHDQPFVDEFPNRFLTWLGTSKGITWAKKFRSVIVDEVQDINEIQWQIIYTFYTVNPNCCLTIVGDDAQNIYTWRGSSVKYLFEFHNYVANCKDFQLRTNYRSTPQIVRIANSVMRFIPTLPFKDRMTAGRNIINGQNPEVHFFYRAADENKWIAEQIAGIYSNHPKMSIAVLARNNSSLFKIEEYLHKQGLLYNLYTQYNPDRSCTHFRRITLATIHAAKGLEWDQVFLMNCHDDCLPSRKNEEDLISERRLFYVAVTRAREHLVFTYSRHEPALSRFVREIPRPFLTYHGICLYKMSSSEQGRTLLSLQERIGSLDGAEWEYLRKVSAIPNLSLIPSSSHALYDFSEFYNLPEWVKNNDCRETWYSLIGWIMKREIAIQSDNLPQLVTPEILETLLTIRIYREDITFWEKYETELIFLIHHFLSYKGEPNIPSVDYATLEEFVKNSMHFSHLSWTPSDLVDATVILGKVRGQLRPLRRDGYDLNDFKFGYVRNSVPTEYRPQVLASWKRVLNISLKTQDILTDLWNLAALLQVREGRNIPLYQLQQIRNYLIMEPVKIFVQSIRSAVTRLFVQIQPSLNILLEIDTFSPLHFDCIGIKPNNNIHICHFLTKSEPLALAGPQLENFLNVCLAAYLLEKQEKHGKNVIEYLDFINFSNGILTRIDFSDTLRNSMDIFWNFLCKQG